MLSKEAQAIETLFNIQDKVGVKVRFVQNHAQIFLDQEEAQPPFRGTLIVKARQKGFSSGIAAKFTVRCLYKSGTHAVIISHEGESTQRLFDKVGYYLNNLNGPKPVLERHSKQQITFPKTQSTYYIGTAGAKAFGRGDFITDLHCSEYAWWPGDAIRHIPGLFQAVPDPYGRIYIESTGNGQDNDFYYMYKNHEKLRYKLLFYPWHVDSEYRTPWPYKEPWKPSVIQHTDYLLNLQHTYHLTNEQMFWYENKLLEMRENLALMQQEYPTTSDEAFQATGGAVFQNITYDFLPEWQQTQLAGYSVRRLPGHPRSGFHYAIGADPSGGTGNDDAACQIFCIETLEQVLAFNNPYVDPVAFAQFLAYLGRLYNEAYVVPEGNNHGVAVVAVLKKTYPRHKIFHESSKRWGWYNSRDRKAAVVGMAKELFEDGMLIHDKETKDALAAFHEDPETECKLEGEEDHLVIGLCLAALGCLKNIRYRLAYPEQIVPKAPTPREIYGNYMYYSLDEVLESIKRRRNNGSCYTRL